VFEVNGIQLHKTSRRGLTVVTLKQAPGTKSIETWDAFGTSQRFDTWKSSGGLADSLESLPEGTIILIGISDEASRRLSNGAKAAIKKCGGQQIDSLGYRSAYALIGVKGGKALAEDLRPSGEGYAIALGRVEARRFADRPFCDARSAAPPVAGSFWDGNLILDAGCRYELRERGAMARSLAGAWVVVTGASNGLLMFHTLLMTLAPSEADEIKNGRFGGNFVIDIFLEGGEIVKYNRVQNAEVACRDVQKTLPGDDHAACKQLLLERFEADSPAYSATMTRITYFVGFFWAGVDVLTDVVQQDKVWSQADVALVVQISAWYVICNTIKFEGCVRKELMQESQADVIVKFKAEMNGALTKLDKFCAPSGRAGRRGCVLGTKSWSAAKGELGDSFNRFDKEISLAMEKRRSTTFRFLDFYELGASMPEETIMGHGSQRLHLWAWQIMVAGFVPEAAAVPAQAGAEECPDCVQVADVRPSSGLYALFGGEMCSAGEATMDHCPKYKEYCMQFSSSGSSCSLWQCMNSVPCSFFTTETEFRAVDGGVDRACRGASEADSLTSYYTVHVNVASLDSCKSLCSFTAACTGVEYSKTEGRCEVWTRAVGTSAPLKGYTCLRVANSATQVVERPKCVTVGKSGDGAGKECVFPFRYRGVTYNECTSRNHRREWCATKTDDDDRYIRGRWGHCSCETPSTTSTTSSPFVEVDGGEDRACRGDTPSDNRGSYFEVRHGVDSIDSCKALCRVALVCTGIEFSRGRCELWRRHIRASQAVRGYRCLSYETFPSQVPSLAEVHSSASLRAGQRRRRRARKNTGALHVE